MKQCVSRSEGSLYPCHVSCQLTPDPTPWQFNSFYKDDFSQRLLVLFVMACLILYGNNAVNAEQDLSDGPARAVAVSSYLVADAAIYGFWLLYSL